MMVGDSAGLFDLSGQVAVVTGGSGVLGGAIASGLAAAGAEVCVLGRNMHRAEAAAQRIRDAGHEAFAISADVLDVAALEDARDKVLSRHGRLDILINAAGGHVDGAATGPDRDFFSMDRQALRDVMELNLMGTILPCQIFGQAMLGTRSVTDGPPAVIVNISSMSADRAVSRVAGYGSSKSAVDGFTRWLAVHCADELDGRIRVNAIAPGFFLAETNRALLTDKEGGLTARGLKIIERTPMKRFGNAEELITAVVWLCAPGSTFVNGTIIPVDGGFSAWSGV